MITLEAIIGKRCRAFKKFNYVNIGTIYDHS